MTRLHTESLCSYSGRSDQQAEYHIIENIQMGNWKINPRCIKKPSFDVSEIDGTHLWISCGFMGNYKIDWLEVSRGHSSQGAGVMTGAWRRTEHSTRWSLHEFQGRLAKSIQGRNQS